MGELGSSFTASINCSYKLLLTEAHLDSKLIFIKLKHGTLQLLHLINKLLDVQGWLILPKLTVA